MMKLVAGTGFVPADLVCEVPSTDELGCSAVLAVALSRYHFTPKRGTMFFESRSRRTSPAWRVGKLRPDTFARRPSAKRANMAFCRLKRSRTNWRGNSTRHAGLKRSPTLICAMRLPATSGGMVLARSGSSTCDIRIYDRLRSRTALWANRSHH